MTPNSAKAPIEESSEPDGIATDPGPSRPPRPVITEPDSVSDTPDPPAPANASDRAPAAAQPVRRMVSATNTGDTAEATTLEVLIVEDNRTNLALMTAMVNRLPGCRAKPFLSPRDAVAGLDALAFDIALVDYQMPQMDGVELIGRIRACPSHTSTPIVMITADSERSVRLAAIEAGAIEFLQKPIEPVEFCARLKSLGALCAAQKKLADTAAWLRSEVEKATSRLREREEEIILRLAYAAGYKDQETGEHTRRMAAYCGLLARRLGLPEEQCRDMELAAPMHDIGKVGIRDSVLQKPGKLDEAERRHINEHTLIGGAILGGSRAELLQLAAEIALTHHERWDGSGYPQGLSGTAIPLSGRIAAVADVFDALTTTRPYKRAWPMEAALTHLEAEAGRQFDPNCVTAFLAARSEVAAIMASMADTPPK